MFFCVFLPSAQREKDLWLGANVLDRRRPRSYLSAHNVVKYLYGVLLPLKVDPVHVAQEEKKKSSVVHLLAELSKTMSDCCSDSEPNKSVFMLISCLERSSWA